MKYLLDTHALIWAITDSAQLSKTARRIIESPENHVLVSAVSFWEISLKNAIGKLSLDNIDPEDFPKLCLQLDFEVVPLDAEACATFHKLRSAHHKDPFDRMLVWLAKCHRLALISKDPAMHLYESEGIRVVW